ncbi:hypothetical protein [Microvirga flavescens]|uniref:hypothetical protein n=1 Tax=Microvirga flavescens TaxID=2249811 RepID=UPI000DDA2C11|nr:hypothetical protein [Microvirga flavescens]
MRVGESIRAGGLGFALAALGAVPCGIAAEAGLAAYQGAWLEQSLSCDAVFSRAGKSTSFKKPIDIFAPAFIISGNRLRTPQASCRITAVKPSGKRHVLSLHCANAVAANDVTVLMGPTPDGSLNRYFNEKDETGSKYQRCDR